MAGSLLDDLMRQWGAGGADLQREIGADERTAGAAAGATLGTVLRSLERKASTPEGADELWKTIEREAKERRIPTESSAKASPFDRTKTDSILKDILGGKAKDVEDRMGKTVQLDGDTMKKVLGTLLPVILGAIKMQAGREGGGKSGGSALPDILGRARKDLEKKQPKSGGILDAILDRDHDGDVDLSDLAGIFLNRG